MAGNELTVQTTLPSIGKLQRSMANEQNMLNKAASLVPSTDAFLKSILDRDIHTAHAMAATNAMQEIAGDYLTNYAKDPFYAFTKRGRGQTSQMQQIVNNPMFNRMEQVKKQNEKEYERVGNKGLLNELVLDDYGRVAVMDQTGRRSFKYASEVDREKEMVLDVNNDYTQLDQYDGSRTAAYDVQALEDTENQIRNTIKGLGTDKWKGETNEIRNSFAGMETGPYGVTNVRETESNARAIEIEIDRLINNGLSPTAMKSLYSAYYRGNPSEIGTEGAEDRAKAWAFQQIGAVVEGQRISKDFTSSKAGLAGAGSGASLATSALQTLPAWRTGELGGKSNDFTFVKAHSQNTEVNNLPVNAAFADGAMTKDENGNPIRMTRYEDFLPSQLANNAAVHIIALADNDEMKIKSGDAIRVGADFLKNGAVRINNPNSVAQMADLYMDANDNILSAKEADDVMNRYRMGEIKPGTPEYAKYITTYTDEEGRQHTGVQLKPAMMFEYMIPKGEGWLSEKNPNAELADNVGYSSSEDIARELNKRAGLTLDSGGWLSNDDEGMVIKVAVPLNITTDAAGSFIFPKDTRSLVEKTDNVAVNQQYGTFVKDLATGQNAVQTGKTGAARGYTNFNNIK